MITIDRIFMEIRELRPDDLDRWIETELVRPQGGRGQYLFQEIDVARIRLILELRDTLEINETALPTVLSLLDQLYEMRRRMRALNTALEAAVPENLRADLLRLLL